MSFPAIRDVVPHSGGMSLLDRIVSHNATETVCLARVDDSQLFADGNDCVPAWVGIEYMAQCIAVHGGLLARAAGEAPRPGLFLGSRRLTLTESVLPTGGEVVVTARHLRGTGTGMQAFACILAPEPGAAPWLEGNLNVMLLDSIPAASENMRGGNGSALGSPS
jgi:predicted hotdog family 3-hydroxylacyl-ACP dehydratase